MITINDVIYSNSLLIIIPHRITSWVCIHIIIVFIYLFKFLFLFSSYSDTVKTKARGILCNQFCCKLCVCVVHTCVCVSHVCYNVFMCMCSFEEKDTMDWVDKQHLR